MLDRNKKNVTYSAYHVIYRNISSSEMLPNSLYRCGLFRAVLQLPGGAVGTAALCVSALLVPAPARLSGRGWDTAPRAKRAFAKARENPKGSLS